MTMGHEDLDDIRVAERLREEIARRRISRQALAAMARVSLSTIEKALTGSRPFTLATVLRIEDALGTSLCAKPGPAPLPLFAPPEMGSYGRQAVRWIEGDYVTLRPSFTDRPATYAYRTRIGWDDAPGHLTFAESDRVDSAFSQRGFVSMPTLSGHIYLVTAETGQYRLIMLGRATRQNRMYGLLTTLLAGTGSQLIPASCPIAFVPLAQLDEPQFGIVREGDPRAESYGAILGTALENDFCRLPS